MRKNRFLCILLCLALSFSLIGCSSSQNNTANQNPALGVGDIDSLLGPQPEDGVIATINGKDLKDEDVQKHINVLRYIYQKNPDDENWDEFYAFAVDYMLLAELYSLILDEYDLELDNDVLDETIANTIALFETPEEFYAEIQEFGLTEKEIYSFLKDDLAYSTIYEHVTKDITVSEDEIVEFFETEKEGFTNVTTRDFYQILFETKEDAEEAMSMINSGLSFEDLTAELKMSDNGYSGTVEKGDLVAPFNDIVWRLENDGDVHSEVVESEMGYHIVMAKNFIVNKTYTLEDVRDSIETYLMETKKGTAMNEFLSEKQMQYSAFAY